jgi:hypothetical protein
MNSLKEQIGKILYDHIEAKLNIPATKAAYITTYGNAEWIYYYKKKRPIQQPRKIFKDI